MKYVYTALLVILAFHLNCISAYGQNVQNDSTKTYKNIVRYDLSGAVLFGINKHIVFGYERVLRKNRSFSINIGRAALLKAGKADVVTDSFTFNDDVKNTGFKVNADYRFYLSKENKFDGPHGVYIGPYISYSQFKRENQWANNNANPQGKLINTTLNMDIFTVGGELGYQFILGKRVALDFVMVGPGVGFYKVKAALESNLTASEKAQLQDAIKELMTQKFPGLNNILANKDFDTEGTINTWKYGFRYLIHIGYSF
jgi:hypothetical protein